MHQFSFTLDIIFLLVLCLVVLVSIVLSVALYKSFIKIKLFNKLNLELNINRLTLNNTYLKHHLLFNYLTNIQAALSSNDFVQSNELLLQLSNMLRKLIERTEESPDTLSIVTVKEELNFLSMFIQFINLQSAHKIMLNTDIKDPLLVNDSKIPFLFLQPILELAQQIQDYNAEEEPSKINLRIELIDDYLVFKCSILGFNSTDTSPHFNKESHYDIFERMELLKEIGLPCSIELENHEGPSKNCSLIMKIRSTWIIPIA